MIKCFVVKYDTPSIQLTGNGGKFTLNCYYLAKVTNSSPNTLCILDDNDNWIPFDYQRMCLKIWNMPRWDTHFSLRTMFFVKNKRELNKFILSKHNNNQGQKILKHVINETVIPWTIYMLRENKNSDDIYYQFK